MARARRGTRAYYQSARDPVSEPIDVLVIGAGRQA